MTPQTKAWIKLVTVAVSTGAAVTTATAAGGCKLWISILTGVGASASAIFHAVSDSPNENNNTTNQPK